MGYCKDCRWVMKHWNYEKDSYGELQKSTIDYYTCYQHRDQYGDYPRVAWNGSCNKFEQEEDKSLSGDGYSAPPSSTSNGYTDCCFLTSACVGYMGKADDCYELTTLRSFRDGYLMKCDGGKELVDEYYKIAPQIVEKIDSSNERNTYYAYIYSVIQKCICCIEGEKFEECKTEYIDMVKNLEKCLA